MPDINTASVLASSPGTHEHSVSHPHTLECDGERQRDADIQITSGKRRLSALRLTWAVVESDDRQLPVGVRMFFKG